MKLKEEINCAMDEPSFSIKIIYIHERAILLFLIRRSQKFRHEFFHKKIINKKPLRSKFLKINFKKKKSNSVRIY